MTTSENLLIAPREVIVIDAGVTDWKTLIAGLSPDIPVILLPAGGNGLEALAAALAGYGALDALHLVSHGGTGFLNLGDLRLSSANLGEQGEALTAIASHLSTDSDLLVYGCSVAASDTGQAFVQELSSALNGVDVAASTDRTGPLVLGGDWDLEYAMGKIETVLPFTVQGMQGIDECLGCSGGNNPGAANETLCTASGGTWSPDGGGSSGDMTAPNVSTINRVTSALTNAASVQYTVTFSESVTGVDTSDFTLTATGTASGTVYSITGSGHTYTVTVNSITGDGTLRLDLNGSGTGIQDTSSNSIATGYTSGQVYTFDHTAPVVSSVDVPANGTYGLSQNLDFTVNFGEAVTVTGTPRLALTIGSSTQYATYVSGSGASALVFRYTTLSGDTDADGITVSGSLDLNGGTLRDTVGNNATLTLNAVAATTGVLVSTVVNAAPVMADLGQC